jgi:hypothetical protein
MAEHKFTVDLSGLELNEAEQARVSGALQRAAMDEVAAVSAARGKGVSLDLQTKFFPGTKGGRLLVALRPAAEG